MTQKILRNQKLNKQSSENLITFALAFIIPICLLGIAVSYLYHSVIEDEALITFTQRYSDFNGTILNGSINESKDSFLLSQFLFYGTSFQKIETIRNIIVNHLDPFFIIITLLKIASPSLFLAVLYIRIGLAGVVANNLVRKHIGIRPMMSLALSTLYALSGPVITVTANPQLIDLAIILPLLIATIDSYVRNTNLKTELKFGLAVSLTAVSGLNGILAGLFVVIVGGIVSIISSNSKALRYKSMLRIMRTTLCGLSLSLFAIIPSIYMAGNTIRIADVFANNIVRYKLFDVIGTMYDGRILTSASVNGIPQIAVSITFLFLYVLFLLNDRIPFSLKLTSMLAFLGLYLSISWSIVDEILSVFGSNEIIIYSRIIVYATLMLLFASISLRNIQLLNTNTIYLASAILLGIMFVHKAVCAEVGPGVFSSLFSFIVIIALTTISIFLATHHEHPLESVIATLILIGMFINLVFVMGPSDFRDDFLCRNDENSTQASIYIYGDNEIPVFASNRNEYVIVPSDLSGLIENTSYPELINITSRTAQQGDIFEKEDFFTVFVSGMTDLGSGIYSPEPSSVDGQIVIRKIEADIDNLRYFVYSGFNSTQTLSEMYGEVIYDYDFMSPFLVELNPLSRDFNMRLKVYTNNSMSEYSLWRYNEQSAQNLASQAIVFDGSHIDLSNQTNVNNQEINTLVTSIDYDAKYVVKSNSGRILPVISVAGKLAIIILPSDNVSSLTIKVPSSDIYVGLALTLLFLLIYIMLYIISSRKNVINLGGNADVKQKNH